MLQPVLGSEKYLRECSAVQREEKRGEERERERVSEARTERHVHIYIHTHTHIHIYTHTYRGTRTGRSRQPTGWLGRALFHADAWLG